MTELLFGPPHFDNPSVASTVAVIAVSVLLVGIATFLTYMVVLAAATPAWSSYHNNISRGRTATLLALPHNPDSR